MADRIPVLCGGRETGAAEAEPQPPYVCLRVRTPRRSGLWRAWAVGTDGEVNVGVLEPRGNEAVIARRFSRRTLAAVGRLLRIELRPVEPASDTWRRADPDEFQDEALRQLAGTGTALVRTTGDRRELAVPMDPDAPFPLPSWFCFARAVQIEGRTCWLFPFDGDETPVF